MERKRRRLGDLKKGYARLLGAAYNKGKEAATDPGEPQNPYKRGDFRRMWQRGYDYVNMLMAGVIDDLASLPISTDTMPCELVKVDL